MVLSPRLDSLRNLSPLVIAESFIVSASACMPADVIKTKVLSGAQGASVWGCLLGTLRAEGLAGLYRGFVPAVARQCPVILVQMPIIEQIRSKCGLGNI